MKNKDYSTDSTSQRKQIFERLQQDPMTTIGTGKAKHRVASYVLMAKVV